MAENTSDDATAIGLELNGFLDVSVVGAAIYGIAVLLCIVTIDDIEYSFLQIIMRIIHLEAEKFLNLLGIHHNSSFYQ